MGVVLFQRDPDTQPEDQWYVTFLSGRTDALLLRVAQGHQMEYTETTLLYHLDTGEAEELFAGVEPSILEQSPYYHQSKRPTRTASFRRENRTAQGHEFLAAYQAALCL